MNALLAWWRGYMLKRRFKRDAARGIAITRNRWLEYWGTMRRVPLGNAAEIATGALSWHVANFAEAMPPFFQADCPTVLLRRDMFWLVIANGILDARTHDPATVRAAIHANAAGEATV